jgi:thymidylate kinase
MSNQEEIKGENRPGILSLERDDKKKMDDSIYNQVSVHGVEGLFSSFQSAVMILRLSRSLGELEGYCTGESIRIALEEFYKLLDMIDGFQFDPTVFSSNRLPFVVAVEGLDGSGKTTLVHRLAEALQKQHERQCLVQASGTPTASMAAVRGVFDQRGGTVARAFYMVSNYVLMYEIWQAALSCKNDKTIVYIVDRWYASTLAYSIGWKNTTGGPQEVDALLKNSPASLKEWPRDLYPPPELLLVLRVDNHVRQERVRARSTDDMDSDNHNPWDSRLQADADLGNRIMRVWELISGPQAIHFVDANPSQETVLEEALAVMQDRLHRHLEPWNYYRRQPVHFFLWTSHRLGLCHIETGRRRKHAPWAMQIALNGKGEAPPSLRTVGIHSVDESGLLFFTRGHPAGGCASGDVASDNLGASIVWVGGDYPHEQQWRSEGVLFEVPESACKVMDATPPPSLVAQIEACEQEEQTDEAVQKGQRYGQPDTHAELAASIRRGISPLETNSTVCGWRFVPLRMEVLMGGPSSPGGPRRFEWNRCPTNVWTDARAILPFSRPSSISSPFLHKRPKPTALVLTGTHCSGKATIGQRVASILGWIFHNELGQVLRDTEKLVAGGHRLGDGSGSQNAVSWDDRLYAEERKRDKLNPTSSRVVETWHVGNLSWALMRKMVKADKKSPGDRNQMVERAKDAIEEHSQVASILFVHLSIENSAIRRRRRLPGNAQRLPLENEEEECEELHSALDIHGLELIRELHGEIPILVLENSVDGDIAIEENARRIVRFINVNLWRSALSLK